MASGAALLFEWEETGDVPADSVLSETRAQVCASCPQNQPGEFSKWFSYSISEMYRKKFAKLVERNLSTSVDAKLNVCAACLCPLRLKVHAPINLIEKHLRPDVRAGLDPRCWILYELAKTAK